MPYTYEPDRIKKCFDEAGMEEWLRLEKTPRGKVSFHVHNHYLQKYIRSCDQVFEIGPGPGRFTIELAKLGAKISVADISSEQLRLNEIKVQEAGYENSISWRKQMDITDLSEIPNDSFDVAVAYGGPLSYIFELVDKALSELLRITKPSGIIFLSVMSTLGTYQLLLELVFNEIEEVGLEEFQRTFDTGDVTGKVAARDHYCRMYRWSGFKSILKKHPCEILESSACAYLSNSVYTEEVLRKVMENHEKWRTFLKWEIEACKEPGIIDGGTHMIAVLRVK
ncbi:MAG: class I SAM-dependent methyltransferase [Promethearchaeota archaeon]|jgi:ubiquinone/menaquinone biosynthesis C-methylase UbiE